MRPFLNEIVGIGLVVSLLSGCASVQERQALSAWQEEGRQWAGSSDEDIRLPELNQEATLHDFVHYALLNNPGLRAAFEGWKGAIERTAPARTLPDPHFTYGYYIEEVETRVGAQKHRFGLTQTFPWYGKLGLRGKIAMQAAHAEHQRYEAAKLRLIYRVKEIYYEYCYLNQAINITKDNVTLLTYLERVARTKYKAGVGLQSAVLKAQVELDKLEDRLHSLQDLMRPVTVKLNIALNRPADSPLPAPRRLPTENHNVVVEDLYFLLRTANPDLKRLEFLSAKEDMGVELAAKDLFPDVTLGVDYIDTAAVADMDPPENGKDPIIAMFSVNLPVWHNKYTAITDEARARLRGVRQERAEKENLLIADLEMALYGLRDAARKIDLYGNTLLPKAEQTMKVTQSAFTSDKASFLDLIDSQRILLRFQLEHLRSLADRAQRMAEIEMLVGGDIERKHK